MKEQDEFQRGYDKMCAELKAWAKHKSDEINNRSYLDFTIEFFRDQAAALMEHADEIRIELAARDKIIGEIESLDDEP